MLPSSRPFQFRIPPVFICFLIVVAIGAPAFGQGFGKIVGAVTDPQGHGIPGARVVAAEAATGLQTSAVTTEEGLYAIPALRPTQYNLSVTANGFKTFSRSGVTLQADEAVTINAPLQVGAASEQVTVSSDAEQVDVATSTLGQVVDTTRVVDLPLNGRNAAQLTVLV